MSGIPELKQRRDEPFFREWAGHVPDVRLAESVASVRSLIDDLIAAGSPPDEAPARDAVARCVQRFNHIDDGWISTIEREDICETICTLVDLAGLQCDDDWTADREW
jgi:hypothetical protein